MVNKPPPTKRSDAPAFRLTLPSLLSLLEQRVFKNPFEIRSFRTLSKNSGVYGFLSIPELVTRHLLRPITSHQSRVTSHFPCYTVPSMARQRLGQHFLADLHWREEIARAIRVSPHSTVPLPHDDQHCWIEIGSGHGEMTQHLLAAGAPVHAIEIDPAFIAGLRRLAKPFTNLTVVPGDILKADLAAIASGRRIRIYGNLPYYITSPILHHLFTFAGLIDEIHIVIQTAVALRLPAQPATRD